MGIKLMADPLTAATIVYVAFNQFIQSEAGKKLVEGSVGKLGEKLTEATLKKMAELREKIWQKLRGKPQAKSALEAVQSGSEAELDQVIQTVQAEMTADPQFAQEIRQLAQQIINIESIEGRNIQNVYSGGEGHQYNNENIKAPVQQGNITNHNYYGNQP